MSLYTDAVLLAEEIMDTWKQYDNGDYSPKGHHCDYCLASSWEGWEDIKHDLNCPVLVAKDILTKKDED